MKKYIKIMLVLAATCMCLTACKQQDTGIIVNVGDTNNDSSQNEQIVGDSGTGIISDNTDNENSAVTKTEVKEIPKIIGTWVTVNGTIYEFKNDGKLNGYLVETGENIRGIYETDNKTYLNITILKEVEVPPEENEEIIEVVENTEAELGTDVTITEPEIYVPIYETVEEPHKYTIQKIVESSDNSGTEMTIIENDIETVLIRSAEIASNSDDYVEAKDTVHEPRSLTPEEVEAANQAALELGIDPVTGLPLPEEPVEGAEGEEVVIQQ